MVTDTGKQTLTVEESARLLGIGRSLAYELAAQGKLPTIKLGRKILISKRGLERMLEGQQDERGDANGGG